VTFVSLDGDSTALLDRFAPVLAAREQAQPCGDGEPFCVLKVTWAGSVTVFWRAQTRAWSATSRPSCSPLDVKR